MRITWNPNEERFEAQFAAGENWQADKDAASSAGFHSDGPPAWIWYARKASVLDRLKEQIPSGIAIARPAMDAYNRLHAIEQKNEELKAWAKEEQKKLKKEREREKISEACQLEGDPEPEPEYTPTNYRTIPEYWKGKSEITRSDLGPDILARYSQRESIPQWRAEPTGVCVMCGSPIFFFEKQDPPTCIWDEEGGTGEKQFMEELIA